MKRAWVVSTAATVLIATGCGERADICLTACGVPIPTTVKVFATATDDTMQAYLLTTQPLHAGLNRVYYRFSKIDNDETVTHAAVTQAPQMTMTTGAHGCPRTDPAPAADADALFEAKLVFTMGGAGGTWSNRVQMTPEGGAAHTFDFAALEVAASAEVGTLSSGGTDYVVTLAMSEASPHVGKNPLVVTLHAAQPDGTYVAITDAQLKLVPVMTSMGHGSPGNVNPTFVADAEYSGVVNLSMSGGWDVGLEVRRAGVLLGTAHYVFRV
ncbi:MAG: FixH family protein [Deltaproteobacteria bacterium]|nr:FixH family protein [Deltaproteobacteria bacterium]